MEGQAEKQPAESQSLDSLVAMFDSEDANTEAEGSDTEAEEEQAEELEVDEAEADESENDSESETVILKHEGKEVSLSKAERDTLAEKGFDYTKKTMALAEERKALEPIRERLTHTVTEHENALQETLRQLHSMAEFVQEDLGEAPDIALAHYDASSYIAQKDAHENRLAKLRTTYAKIQHFEHQQNQLRQSQLLQKANETEAYLVENLSGWKDAPEKSLQELNTYIKGYGLSPETTKDAYVERGLWEIAHKAREYDKLKAAQSQLKPKATLPKVIKHSTNQTVNVREQDARKRFAAKPSLDTLAGLMPDF